MNCEFNDLPIVQKIGYPITGFVVRAGEVVNSIQAVNGPYTLPQHGGNGGSGAEIILGEGDRIVEVSGFRVVWYGHNGIAYLSIKTVSGMGYGPFGDMDGDMPMKPFCFKTDTNQGEQVVAFMGTTTNVPLARGNNMDIVSSLGIGILRTDYRIEGEGKRINDLKLKHPEALGFAVV